MILVNRFPRKKRKLLLNCHHYYHHHTANLSWMGTPLSSRFEITHGGDVQVKVEETDTILFHSFSGN